MLSKLEGHTRSSFSRHRTCLWHSLYSLKKNFYSIRYIFWSLHWFCLRFLLDYSLFTCELQISFFILLCYSIEHFFSVIFFKKWNIYFDKKCFLFLKKSSVAAKIFTRVAINFVALEKYLAIPVSVVAATGESFCLFFFYSYL